MAFRSLHVVGKTLKLSEPRRNGKTEVAFELILDVVDVFEGCHILKHNFQSHLSQLDVFKHLWLHICYDSAHMLASIRCKSQGFCIWELDGPPIGTNAAKKSTFAPENESHGIPCQ